MHSTTALHSIPPPSPPPHTPVSIKAPCLNELHDTRTSADSQDSDKEINASVPQLAQPAPKSSYRTWLVIVWPLIVHIIITISITVFMVAYVNNRDFNPVQRRPSVRLIDDSIVPWVHFAPLQTDIATVLSVLIAILRLVTACWLGPLCWRCAFILMEEFGLPPTQLRNLISFSVTIVPPRTTSGQKKRSLQFLLWAVLLVVLPVQVATPVLTGSITWLASNPPPERLSDSPLLVTSTENYDEWNLVMKSPLRSAQLTLEMWVQSAAFRPFLAWGRDTSNAALKRFVTEFSTLDINNTVANITIPYFTVQSIEWIDSPNSEWVSDLTVMRDTICPLLNVTDSRCPVAYVGALALIPDAPWTIHTSQSPSKVTERRLMIYSSPTSGIGSMIVPEYNCRYEQGGGLNPNVTGYPTSFACWKFAWVTYSAGVGFCKNCRVSSYSTVQNDTELELQEGYLTAEALSLMPSITQQLLTDYHAVTTIPKWDNADDYVIGMLTRAYAGAWMSLTELVVATPLVVTTTYSVSPPASRAIVNLLRVYIWLGLQCLIPLSGILYVCIQALSNSPLIGDTTLLAFHLDSSLLHNDTTYDQWLVGVPRKVELEDSRLVVKLKAE